MKDSSSSSTVELDPNIQALVDQIMGYAPDLMARPFPTYDAPRIAGFTPDQLQGFQNVRQNAAQSQPMAQQARQTLQGFAQGPQIVGRTPMMPSAQPNVFQGR